MRVALLCAVLLAAHAHFADDLVLGEDPRKPIEVDDVLLCHSCHAAVIETVRHVKSRVHTKPWSENIALAFLDDLCKPENLKRYEFIPPKMVRGCLEYINRYGDEFQDALAVGGTADSLGRNLCSKLCLPHGIVFEDPDVADARRKQGKQSTTKWPHPKQATASAVPSPPAEAHTEL